MNTFCYVCGKVDPIYQCERCQHARYCSSECQSKDWNEAWHAEECYNVNSSNLDEIKGEVMADLEELIPSSYISDANIERAMDILDSQSSIRKCIAWLKETRMNAHIASMNDLHTEHEALEDHLNLHPNHGMNIESMIGQAVMQHYVQRVEGPSDWLDKAKGWWSKKSAKRKQAKADKGAARQQRKDEIEGKKRGAAESKRSVYQQKADIAKDERKNAKWYQVFKKRDLKKKEDMYRKKSYYGYEKQDPEDIEALSWATRKAFNTLNRHELFGKSRSSSSNSSSSQREPNVDMYEAFRRVGGRPTPNYQYYSDPQMQRQQAQNNLYAAQARERQQARAEVAANRTMRQRQEAAAQNAPPAYQRPPLPSYDELMRNRQPPAY